MTDISFHAQNPIFSHTQGWESPRRSRCSRISSAQDVVGACRSVLRGRCRNCRREIGAVSGDSQTRTYRIHDLKKSKDFSYTLTFAYTLAVIGEPLKMTYKVSRK